FAGFRKTLDWVLRRRPEYLNISHCLVLPGSDLWRQAREFGLVFQDDAPLSGRSEEFVPGSGIEVSAADPLLAETIRWTRSSTRTFTGKPWRVLPRRRAQDVLAAREALARIKRYWPREHRDILFFTRLLVPVDGNSQQAGTLKPMLGGVFFPFSPHWWVNMENLIHEAAHLRLSYHGLLGGFTRGDEGYVRSPWSRVPRRPSIVLQAGYIYLLAAEGLLRALDSGDRFVREPLIRRAERLLAGYPGYWKLAGRIPLTPLGESLVEACRRRHAALAGRRP
ncbi:MAG: hypothetical protein KGL04_05700, partial [Elusimicrobia bacterium]|nr:hypothetical protein [Elusimicrobiota bacterium]